MATARNLKPLDFSAVRFYDRISYSLYLLHLLDILLASRIAGIAGFTPLESGCGVSGGNGTWQFIEVPFVRKGYATPLRA
jgi:peptidoglycan/LPS O-acetylase OafA/YrhL